MILELHTQNMEVQLSKQTCKSKMIISIYKHQLRYVKISSICDSLKK